MYDIQFVMLKNAFITKIFDYTGGEVIGAHLREKDSIEIPLWLLKIFFLFIILFLYITFYYN